MEYEAASVMVAVIGSIAMGVAIGLFPMIIGIVKKRKVLGFVAFGACIVTNFLSGIILSIPTFLILTLWLIALPNRRG